MLRQRWALGNRSSVDEGSMTGPEDESTVVEPDQGNGEWERRRAYQLDGTRWLTSATWQCSLTSSRSFVPALISAE